MALLRFAAAALSAAMIIVAGVAFLAGRAPVPQSPIAEAASRGDLPAVQAYLSAGGDPNAAGAYGFRLPGAAARNAQLPVLTALLDAGADPNLRDGAGNHWVPLMHAVHKHRPAAVRLLLERGAAADGPADLRVTPLMMAVGSGQTDVVQMLLDRGANPRRRSPDGASLLTLAVSGGALTDIDEPLLGACHAETVRLLRSRAPGLVVDNSSWRGRLAVWFARLNGCTDVLAMLNSKIG